MNHYIYDEKLKTTRPMTAEEYADYIATLEFIVNNSFGNPDE